MFSSIMIVTKDQVQKKLLTDFFIKNFPSSEIECWDNYLQMLNSISYEQKSLVVIDSLSLNPAEIMKLDKALHSKKVIAVLIDTSEDGAGTYDYFCDFEAITLMISDRFDESSFAAYFKMLALSHYSQEKLGNFNPDDLVSINTDKIKYKYNAFEVLNHSSDGMWLWDIPNNRIHLSDLFRKALGYNKDDLGDDLEVFVTLIHPEDKKVFRSALSDYLDNIETRLSIELRLHHADGSYRWFLLRGYAVRDCNDAPTKMIGIQMDINYMKSQIERLENIALYDTLTGLPNRSLLYDRISRGIADSNRTHKMLGLMFIDLDNFKAVNDTYGHSVGDLVLQKAANILLDNVRKIDTVSRLHGDEFIIVSPLLTQPESIQSFAERIHEAFKEPMILGGHQLKVSCSIGTSVYPKDGSSIEALLEKADTSMYKRKNMYKNLYKPHKV